MISSLDFPSACAWKLVLTRWRKTGIAAFLTSSIATLKRPTCTIPFYSFDEYASLLGAARTLDARTHVAVLLGGDAGLRRGEDLMVQESPGQMRMLGSIRAVPQCLRCHGVEAVFGLPPNRLRVAGV